MKAEIGYGEIVEYIQRNYDKTIGINHIDTRTVAVSTNVKVLIPVNVSLNVSVERAIGSDVVLSYAGRFGVDAIVTSVLMFLDNKADGLSQLVEYDGNHTVVVHLAGIEQLKRALEVINLRDLWFTPDGVGIELGLR